MLELKVLKLDLKMENPNNWVVESQPTNAHGYFKPNYSPFFTKGFRVYDGLGALLTPGKDYTLESLAHPLMLRSGKEIKLYVKVTNKETLGLPTIQFHYHSTGNTGLPNALLKEMKDLLVNNQYWADYEDKVVGKPETFPAFDHWHDVATEIANWDHLIELTQTRLNWLIHKQHQWETLTQTLNTTANEFTGTIRTLKDAVHQHDEDYQNPHKLMRKDFPLTSVMNAPLASLDEDLAGLSQHHFTTPLGLRNTLDKTSFIPKAYLPSGVLTESGIDFTHPLNQVVRGTIPNTHTGQYGSWLTFPALGLYYEIVGVPSLKTLGSQYYHEDKNQYGLLNSRLTLPGFDLISHTIESGVMVKNSASKVCRYYRNPMDLVSGNTKFVVVNDQAIVSLVGDNWLNSSWVITTKDITQVIVRYVKDQLPQLSVFTLTGNTLVLTPFTHTLPNGRFSNPVTTFNGVYSEKDGNNRYTKFHHRLSSPVTTVTVSNNLNVITAKRSTQPHIVLFKMITSVTVTGQSQPIPIEVVWEYNVLTNTWVYLNGHNETTLVNNQLPSPGIIGELSQLSGVRTIPVLKDNQLLVKCPNNHYLKLRLINAGPITPFIYGLNGKVVKQSEILPVNPTQGFPDTNWVVTVPSPLSVSFKGTLLTLPVNHYHLTDYLKDPRNKVIYQYVAWIGGIFQSFFDTKLVNNSDWVKVAKITTNNNGITKIEHL